eukprot:TRINITY_DN1226_c0_g1_i1.p1 TRINITY_DN1226_c0_g1~~TRINITY_DN1226_c0_g1_i1.p1  ORF type:complete len:241 (+),score=131.75 TRINITY_DN1226_c0_g1_i1:46-768(+)
MPLHDTVESLRADVEELEGFVAEAQQSEVKKLLQKDLDRLRREYESAVEDEEAAAAKAEKAAKKKAEAEAAAAAAAEAEAEKKAAKKAEKDAAKAAAAGGAITTPNGLKITAECNAAMNKMKTGLGTKPKDTAFIAKIGKDGDTLEYVEWLDDADIEDIADELTELDPAFIFYTYKKVMPDGRLKTPLVFLFYSPQKAPAKKSMAATRWKQEVGKTYDVVKTLQVRDLDDFDQEWFDSVS